MKDAIMNAGRTPATRPGEWPHRLETQLRLELSIPLLSNLHERVTLPISWLMEQS